MGAASGCGCKDVFILLMPTPLVSVLFLQQHPYFLFFFKVGMSKMLHRHKTLQTCEYLELGTL